MHYTHQYFILGENCEPVVVIPIANVNKPMFFSSDYTARILLTGESYADFWKEPESGYPHIVYSFWREVNGKQLACLFNRIKTTKTLLQMMEILGGSVKIEWNSQGKEIAIETQHTLTIYSDRLHYDDCEDEDGFIYLSSYIKEPFSWADAIALGNKMRDFCKKIVAGEIL